MTENISFGEFLNFVFLRCLFKIQVSKNGEVNESLWSDLHGL